MRFQAIIAISMQMAEGVRFSETCVNIYHTTRCNIPKDSYLLSISFLKRYTHEQGSGKLTLVFNSQYHDARHTVCTR
jgi:hypothetical protein